LVLARAFLNNFNTELGRSLAGFAKSAVAAMEAHDWPGNVREIESRIKRAVILADGNQITPEDLELSVSEEEPLPFNLKQVREEAEKQAIIRALNHSGENVSHAAKLLGVTRPTLYNMMEKYGLTK
jgi:two-component system NtrC family response regulator